MKPEMLTLKVGPATIKVPASGGAQSVLAGVLTQLHHIPVAVPSAVNQSVPPLGAYWPGQGGHNGGLVPERDGIPAHYLIVAAKDIGDHAWGRRGEESGAISKWDGLANTKALLSEGGHPAAEEARKYTADGHADFYLPAAAELYQCWIYTPDLFAKDCWYWSSSQRSANYAFTMSFDVGVQDYGGKNGEFRVRPVRRLFI